MINKKHILLMLSAAWILGCHKGYLALFNAGNPVPVKTFPYRLEGFPPEDQDALRNGIHAASEEELLRLMQDHMS